MDVFWFIWPANIQAITLLISEKEKNKKNKKKTKQNKTKKKNKMSASFVCFLGISLLMLLNVIVEFWEWIDNSDKFLLNL